MNYINQSNRSWVKDNRENWLIIITDASKFDDDPWPSQSNNFAFPNKVNQISEEEACETFNALREIYDFRMIFGTADKSKHNAQWQLDKFQSINENDNR